MFAPSKTFFYFGFCSFIVSLLIPTCTCQSYEKGLLSATKAPMPLMMPPIVGNGDTSGFGTSPKLQKQYDYALFKTKNVCNEFVKSYRPYEREPEAEKAKPCLYYQDLGENFLPTEDSKTIYNPERDESVIKEHNLKTLVTTYQMSYCSNVGKKSLVIDPNDLEADQFLGYFNKYYAPRTHAVPRPVDTSRRVNGYTRFSYYYTGKSEFEETISREGYKYFRRDYEMGKSRLFAKKQAELRKLKEAKEGKGELRGDGKEGPDADKRIKFEEDKGSKGNKKEEVQDGETATPSSKEKTCVLCCEKYDGSATPQIPIQIEKC